jgi:hypothetical protein
MANGPAELRALARYIAPPVLDEGVAAIIEAIVLPRARVAARNARRLLATAVEAAEVAEPGRSGRAPARETAGRRRARRPGPRARSPAIDGHATLPEPLAESA